MEWIGVQRVLTSLRIRYCPKMYWSGSGGIRNPEEITPDPRRSCGSPCRGLRRMEALLKRRKERVSGDDNNSIKKASGLIRIKCGLKPQPFTENPSATI